MTQKRRQSSKYSRTTAFPPASILRHSDPKLTTEIYAHLASEYLRAEVDRLSFGEAVLATVPGRPELVTRLLPAPDTGKRKAGTPRAKAQEVPAWRLERETGFEPATLSLGSDSTESADLPNGSQAVASAGNARDAGASSGSQGFQAVATDAAAPTARVAPVLRVQGAGKGRRAGFRVVEGAGGHLLTVRAVAGRLGVSTASVYKLCDSGALAHVRVGNAIRVTPAALAAFMAGGSARLK